ncbi:MAG: diguanylate cyclase [Planctomycetaceae bacterium]
MTSKINSAMRLPSLPTVAIEILKIFDDPNADARRISEIVEADPAIASKVLKAANSPKYSARGEISDVRRAVTMMGKNNVTPLVLSFSLSSESMVSAAHAEYFKQFWLRSYVQAVAAEILGESRGPRFSSECFTTNLLAGIGLLGMLKAEPEGYIECRNRLRTESLSLTELEREVFGISHRELSEQILQNIGMPERCISAVRFISSPVSAVRSGTDEADRMLMLVTRCADAVARYLCDTDSGLAFVALEERVSDVSDVVRIDKDSLLIQVRQRLDASADLFNVDPSRLPDPSDLLQEALEQLSEFATLAHDAGTDRRVPAELLEENGRLKMRVEDLIQETCIDPLTRVYNRKVFFDKLQELQAVSRLRKHDLGIAVMDIDHFKRVNDTYGHAAGDYVLKQVAQALCGASRTNEILARYGGEEFSLLLENTNPAGMETVAERMRSTVEKLFVCFEGTQIPVTISVGIASGTPTADDRFAEQLFSLADAALYQAKHSGRNCAVVDSTLVRGTLANEPAAIPNCSGCAVGSDMVGV